MVFGTLKKVFLKVILNRLIADKINRIGQLRHGVIKVIENPKYSPDVSRKYTVADMITGYGVAIAAKHFYDVNGDSIVGKRTIVQGFGNVGAAAAVLFCTNGSKSCWNYR